MPAITKATGQFWQVIWFFALDTEAQRKLTDFTGADSFMDEGPENPGANYLRGMCYSADEFCSHMGFTLNTDLHAMQQSVRTVIAAHEQPRAWAFDTLTQTPEWQDVREKAAALLALHQPAVPPPVKPFKIETLIRTDHYEHDRAARAREGDRKFRRP